MSKTAFDLAVQSVRDGKSVQEASQTLFSELNVQEKLSMLTGSVGFWPGLKQLFSGGLNKDPYVMGKIDRLGIPGIRFCDGPRGVVIGEATCFPAAIARGATWDTTLEARVGRAIAQECKSKGVNTSGSICINLPRHPAWGRIQESYGEDPIILGEFGIAMTEALQQNGVMACVKHYALNSMEDSRFHVDVTADDTTLREVYLAHFEMVVRAGAMSVMTAYNSVNGEWCGQNGPLLDILRSWGFEGFVISDWIFGLRDSAKSVKAGLDLEAPFSQIRTKLQKELEGGKFTIDDVDRSVARTLSMQVKCYSQMTDTTSEVLCKAHRELSREVAQRSMVLLKNGILPLDAATINSCALIGVLAKAENTGDWGSSYVNSPDVVTPYEGFRSALPGKVTLTASDSTSLAKKAAASADVAVVVVGYGAKDEGENLSANNPMSLIPFPTFAETFRDVPPILYQQLKAKLGLSGGSGPSMGKAGGDRKSLRLSNKNVELIRAVRSVNPRTIVVIVASGAVIMDDWTDEVDTVLMNWYSGCDGGHALADVILGKVDASGRLPFSIPSSEKHLPYFDAAAKKITYDKWFGQRLLDKLKVPAKFPLGFGLSYTSFDVQLHTLEQRGDRLCVDVEVTNKGTRAGRHVVQVYGLSQADDFPSRVLLGFSSIALEVGQSEKVTINARLRPLQRWAGQKFVLASENIEIEVGDFAGDANIRQSLQLTAF